jgi:AAA family ATP:ADP antiporter
VLSSWYVLRPVRNEMAVTNVDELPFLLAAGAVAMLLVNPIYSWIASKSNLKKIILFCYSFLIMNLILFLFAWKVLDLGESIWLGRIFYVWCNIYSFFVVSIFWVLVINLFRDSNKRSFYGVIMAGGSIGAMFGSEISKRFSSSFNELGLELFTLSAALLLFFAMLLALYMLSKFQKDINLKLSDVGGGSFDAIKNSLRVHEIRNIATYVWIWTALMTIQWITAINIVEEWSQNPEQRLRFFAIVEQVTSPLTLVVQLFLTNIIIKKFGIRNIMFLYGILFFFAYLAYGLAPSIISVGVVTVLLRIFEYGVNKPTRETIFTTFKKNDRYKSTVFIDTFITRFGDLSGSGFIALGKLTSVAANSFPLIAIPIAGYLSFLGIKISKKVQIKGL